VALKPRAKPLHALIGGAMRFGRCALVVFSCLAFAGCEPPYHDVACWLPVLRTDELMRTLIQVGDREDRISNTCSVPIARLFQAERQYGDLTFYWWGSPHRLYLAGRTAAGQQLEFRGDRVESYDDSSGSFLAEYSHRITFHQGNDLLNKPTPEHVVIEVLGPDGRSLDTIQGTYEAVLCSCAVPDYISGARP